MKGIYLLFFVGIVVLVQCKNVNSENDYPQLDGHILKISNGAGSLVELSGLESSIPSFFNFGFFNQKLPTFLIAKDLSNGDKIEIYELGVLEFSLNDSITSILIAAPSNSDYAVINANTYNEFSINYPQLKNLFELWIKTNCQENSCTNIKWKNDLKAKLLVQEALTK